MDSERVRRLTAIATLQHGAIAVSQLRRAGVTARLQRSVQDAGWLEMVEPTVLVVAGSPDTWHRRLQTGLLALAGRGWVSHEAAARLHGLDRSRDEAVEFTVRRSARAATCSATVHTTRSVAALDVVTVNGFRCASATRTILDLAGAGSTPRRLEAAIDSAVRLGLSAPLVLERRLGELRGRGRRGARLVDRLLVDSGGESVLERRFLELMRRGGLPRPLTQAVQRRDGRHVARVDFLFAEHGIVVEVTGRLGHSTPSDRACDAQRRNELTDLGLKLYEFTWSQVTERPMDVLASMRSRLGLPFLSAGSTDFRALS